MRRNFYLLILPLLALLSSCTAHRHLAIRGSSASVRVRKPLQKAVKEWLDVPYRYGGEDKKGVDCSAFVCAVYANAYHKHLPRTSREQFELSKPVKRKRLHQGDLVFFNPGTREVSHVGIFLGDHYFVHASVSKGVVVADLDNAYYQKIFMRGGRRKSIH